MVILPTAVVGQVHRWGWREIWEFVNETGGWSLRQLLEKMWGSYEGRYKRHFDSFLHLTCFFIFGALSCLPAYCRWKKIRPCIWNMEYPSCDKQWRIIPMWKIKQTRCWCCDLLMANFIFQAFSNWSSVYTASVLRVSTFPFLPGQMQKWPVTVEVRC